MSLLYTNFVYASVLISFRAIIDKVDPIQLVILVLIEVVIQVWKGLILPLPIFISPNLDLYFDDSLNWRIPDGSHSLKIKIQGNEHHMNPTTIEESTIHSAMDEHRHQF